MTFDTHLINLAIAGIGISAGVAVLIAGAIIGFAAIWTHGRKHTTLTAAEPIRHEEITQVPARQAA